MVALFGTEGHLPPARGRPRGRGASAWRDDSEHRRNASAACGRAARARTARSRAPARGRPATRVSPHTKQIILH